jgi:hypothetical protein
VYNHPSSIFQWQIRYITLSNINLITQNYRVYGFCSPSAVLNNWKTQCFGNWTCFRIQVRRERETPTLLLDRLERANFSDWRTHVPFNSPEDVNRSSFQNIVFPSYLQFWTMEKHHKPSNSTTVRIFQIAHKIEQFTNSFSYGYRSFVATMCILPHGDKVFLRRIHYKFIIHTFTSIFMLRSDFFSRGI